MIEKYYLYVVFLSLSSCLSTQKQKFTQYKYAQQNQLLNQSITTNLLNFVNGFKAFKKEARIHNNDKNSLAKITKYALLDKDLGHINHIITKIKKKFIQDAFFEEFQNPQKKHITGLQKSLDKYAASLQSQLSAYVSDTTSWTRRYLKLLPPDERQNPPNFIDFYFKNTSRAEALVVLSTLQLGILQEALEIQEKILKVE